jgi:TRAP-type mannitol/chloroaromatic compound transport system permease small subunit
MYGTMFMMAGAYTLSRGQHVRGDFLYRTWRPRTQGAVDLVLYVTFFYPGVLALIFTGWKYSSRSWGYGEVSVNSPAGVPIYQFKSVLVAAGLLLAIQGLAEILRCIIAIRDNRWMTPEDDVVETEELLMRKAAEAETENHP